MMLKRYVALAILGALILSACSASLEGDGDVVTETRTVSDFDVIHADNGVDVVLTVDSAATGDPILSVTTDSNLQEFLATNVTGSTLNVSSDRSGGVRPTGAFDVSGTVDVITDVSVDNGARVEVTGTISDVRLFADNGAQFDGDNVEVGSVEVDADNGAQITVCSSGTVTGEVRNGAQLTVLCGGSITGVETSDGGTVSSSP
jgi:cytoskeletal protein CcmA (bactofilin family)